MNIIDPAVQRYVAEQGWTLTLSFEYDLAAPRIVARVNDAQDREVVRSYAHITDRERVVDALCDCLAILSLQLAVFHLSH